MARMKTQILQLSACVLNASYCDVLSTLSVLQPFAFQRVCGAGQFRTSHPNTSFVTPRSPERSFLDAMLVSVEREWRERIRVGEAKEEKG